MSRKKGSGMSSSTSSGASAASRVLGKSADAAAENYWNTLKIPASEKYAQAEGAAKSLEGGVLSAETHVYDVLRTQAGGSNPDLTSGSGWKTGYQQELKSRLGESGQREVQSAIQRQAQKWLKRNPRPKNPRKDGYKWDGTKYVKR